MIGELDPPGQAHEQADTEKRLQRPHPVADGGRREIELGRSGDETPVAGGGLERLEVDQGRDW